MTTERATIHSGPAHTVTANPGSRTGKRPSRIDWAAARTWWFSQPTASWQNVADRFGVSEGAVRHHARLEKWRDQRNEILARAAEAATKPLEEVNRDTLRLIDEARTKFREQLRGEYVVSGRDMAALLRIEQLIFGEATDRVAFNDFRGFIVAIGEGFKPLVAAVIAECFPSGNGKRELAVQRIGDGFLELLERSASQVGPPVIEGKAS